MDPEGSLPHSQVPATCSYSEPAQSGQCPHIALLEDLFNINSLLCLGVPNGLFPSRFPTKTMYTALLYLIRATYQAHFILLYFIYRIIFGEQYRSLSSSLCSFLHSPVTSPLIDPNIPLNPLISNTLSLRSPFSVTDQVSHPH